MPRPRKAGLDYYYKGVHEWDDIEMTELLQKYGPMGYCIYEVVRSKVYESGYYLEFSLDRLACYVIKTVGNRWIRDKSIALQVIRYCAEIGLFDNALMQQSVITSVNIQQHYAEVTARSKADKSKYWLLGDSEKSEHPAEQPDLSAKEVSAAKTEVFSAKTREFPENMHQSKENKTKQKKMKAKQSAPAGEEIALSASACGNMLAAAALPEEYDKVEEKYVSITGRHFRKSDIAALEEMRSMGATDSVILYAMNQVANRGNKEIGSLRYFLPIVREALRNNKDSPSAATKAKPDGKSERLPETSETDEIERILDEEWLSIISKYEPMSEEDYV